MFIAIEGPNGVGKTTVAGLLAAQLAHHTRIHAHLTTEPSHTPLGRFLRDAEATLHGRALALALAADRYTHIDEEIIPELDAGHHVVCDRYVQSSLVLQRVDAVEIGEIWAYNRYVLPPAASIYLEDDPDTIGTRLAGRTRLSRLEATGSPQRELQLYRDARRFLGRQDWYQQTIDCRGLSPEQVVTRILACLPDGRD
jgi:dTMP kinase